MFIGPYSNSEYNRKLQITKKACKVIEEGRRNNSYFNRSRISGYFMLGEERARKLSLTRLKTAGQFGSKFQISEDHCILILVQIETVQTTIMSLK